MDAIESLKEDLWRRWRSRMEQSPITPEPPAGTDRVVYGRGPLFDLKAYTPQSFEPGGRSSAEPFSGHDNWIYRLDAAGRPIRMETRHSFNGIDWHGVYEYTPDGADYAEWCLQTGVCSEYARITIRETVPAAFQRLMVNGKGSFPVWRGVAAPRLIERIASDAKNYQILIERYDVRDRRIAGGESYTEGMGAPPTRSTLTYAYVDGKLDRITQHSASEGTRTVSAAPRPVSLEQLSADLSRRIAQRTIELVRQQTFEAPLAAVELSYRSVETYVPLIIPCTAHDEVSELCLCVAIDSSRWIQLPEEELAPEVTDFHQRVRMTEQFDIGTRMLREAARQVTQLARQQLSTTPWFVAYAIDWELEGDQLQTILRDCGASASTMRELKSRGWI